MNPKQETRTTLKQNLLRNIIFSAVIPLIIFYGFKQFNMLLTGIELASGWSIAVIVISLVKEHKMNYIALLTAISLVIGLVGTIISKNLIYYLLSPIITRAIWAAIFLVSLLFSKSLFQVIVESIVAFPEILKTKKTYRQAWIILTMIWGIYQLLLAILFLILIHTVSVSVYVTLTMISSVCDIGLTMFSFWFGRWYLGRTRVANSDN